MGMHGDLRTELIAGQEARAVRRKWPDEVKAQLVADSYAEGAKVGDVARRAGLQPSHLSMWRRQAREGVLAASEAGGAEFAEMVVAQEAASEGWIEIEHGGTTIRLDAGTPAERVAGIVHALNGRG